MIAGLIVLGVLVILGGMYAGIFNGLIHTQQKVHETWSDIDAALKRRYDLIPNLVNTVKGYAKHEQETLEKVIQARSQAIAVPEGNTKEQAQAENMLSSTLKSIFALSESYPDLKANQNFLNLQNELTETEDQIYAARRLYNGNVTSLNTKIKSFPSNIVASMHNFKEADFFEMDEAEKSKAEIAPDVSF